MKEKYKFHKELEKTYAKRCLSISPILSSGENILGAFECIIMADDLEAVREIFLYVVTSKRLIYYDISIEKTKTEFKEVVEEKYTTKIRHLWLNDFLGIGEECEGWKNSDKQTYRAKICFKDGNVFEDFGDCKKPEHRRALQDFISTLIEATSDLI